MDLSAYVPLDAAVQEAMSPVDELFACMALVAESWSQEDIAADLGVTPLVVKRRSDWRASRLTCWRTTISVMVSLEQLMALTITDDRAAQEPAFYEALQCRCSLDSLRDHLTRDVNRPWSELPPELART